MLRITKPTRPNHWINDLLDEDTPLTLIRPGAFLAPLNAHYMFDTVDQHPKIEALGRDLTTPWPWYISYGVHDSAQAFLDEYGEALEADPRELLVLFVAMRRDEQYEEGGWRWHKWGPMIGKQVPTTEYLYNEPEIESVVVFHVYEI